MSRMHRLFQSAAHEAGHGLICRSLGYRVISCDIRSGYDNDGGWVEGSTSWQPGEASPLDLATVYLAGPWSEVRITKGNFDLRNPAWNRDVQAVRSALGLSERTGAFAANPRFVEAFERAADLTSSAFPEILDMADDLIRRFEAAQSPSPHKWSSYR